MTWHARLREAVNATGQKHSTIAWEAAIDPATLSRIINGHDANPRFETVVRIAHAARVAVGWVLDEPVRGIELTERQRATVRAAGAILLNAFKGES